jgi:hypothetical protein
MFGTFNVGWSIIWTTRKDSYKTGMNKKCIVLTADEGQNMESTIANLQRVLVQNVLQGFFLEQTI